MDEQLQLKIAEAIARISEGAPEMWQSLVAEVYAKSSLGFWLSLTIGLPMLIIFICIMQVREKEDRHVVFLLCVGFIAAICFGTLIDNAMEMTAPQIELLKILNN